MVKEMKDQKIIPNLWFDHESEEAAEFYTSLFADSKIGTKIRYTDAGKEIHAQETGSVMTVEFELAGLKIVALNGGPLFKFTPAISFYVTCESEFEVDKLWNALLNGGQVLMPLEKYDWSEKYGWVQDKYGLSWQISLGKMEDVGQKVVPLLMYVNEKGRAEEAIKFYTSVFDDSEIVGILKYGPNEDQPEGNVMHAQFKLNGEVFMAMDTHPKYAEFNFSEAISLLIDCYSQEEIDHFWENLKEGGDPKAQVCGWLKDKYGLSWQVAPAILNEMMQDPDPAKVARVTDCFMKMKKMDINELQRVYNKEAS